MEFSNWLILFWFGLLANHQVKGEAPTFGAETDAGSVAEDATIGTTIPLTPASTALDNAPTAITIRDTSTPDGAESLFAVALTTAKTDFVLTTAAALDRETTASYTLNVQASNNDGADKSTDFVVTITVTDVNDSPPVIKPASSCIEMAMGSVAGDAVTTVEATDADEAANGLAASPYALVDASDVYALDTGTGAVTVKTGATLDSAEKGATLKVTAKDKGTHTSTAQVKICIGDGCCINNGADSVVIRGTILAFLLVFLSKFV